jgi:hypothetical protein
LGSLLCWGGTLVENSERLPKCPVPRSKILPLPPTTASPSREQQGLKFLMDAVAMHTTQRHHSIPNLSIFVYKKLGIPILSSCCLGYLTKYGSSDL